MTRLGVLLCTLAGSLLAGCSGETSPQAGGTSGATAATCEAGERLVEGTGCLPAGVGDDGCAAGEIGLAGGSCQAAGIAPELCANGFDADGEGGCEPVLPNAPCPDGSMATPGETVCRDVAPCGAGSFGDIPVEADTQYVDAAYAGGVSDGTTAKPWTTIQAGIDAAPPGAIVAVAAGSYAEDVRITGKPVRLWGRCPGMVEIAGSAVAMTAVFIDGAGSTEVHRVAIRGAADGVGVSNAQDVLFDQLWIHDTADAGLRLEDSLGPTRVTVERSLIESAGGIGMVILGSEVSIEATIVRRTKPLSDLTFGLGAIVQDDPNTGQRSTFHVRASVFEQNFAMAMFIAGSDATIEATVVRDTQPDAHDKTSGRGIGIQRGPTGQPSNATVRSSFVDRNHDAGIFVSGSTATIESTVVRGTDAEASDQTLGVGLSVQSDPTTGARSSVTLRASLVDGNHAVGVAISGSDATVESTIVRRTAPQVLEQNFGRGISAQDDGATGQRAKLVVKGSLVDDNADEGVFVSGSDATIEGTLVRATTPQQADRKRGWGVGIQASADTLAAASAAIRTSVIDGNVEVGILVAAADVTIDASVVRSTAPSAADGNLGDGVTAVSELGPAHVTLTDSIIEGSARAGASAFGANVELGATRLECNSIELDGETFGDAPFGFVDRGADVCGCKDVSVPCQVLTSHLTAPTVPTDMLP